MTSNEILSLGICFITVAIAITVLLNFAAIRLMKYDFKKKYKELACLKEREAGNLEFVTKKLKEIENNEIDYIKNEDELISMKNSLEELKEKILVNLDDINELEKEIEFKLKKI